MINNAKPRRATQTAIIAPSQAIAFPPTTTTHREHAQQQIGTHAPPTEHEEIPEICPKRNGKKKCAASRTRGTEPPLLILVKRGAIGEEWAAGGPWGWPESHLMAPAPLPRWLEPGRRSKRRALVFWLAAALFFFPTSILLAFCCAACVSPAAYHGVVWGRRVSLIYVGAGDAGGATCAATAGELPVSAALRKRGTELIMDRCSGGVPQM